MKFGSPNLLGEKIHMKIYPQVVNIFQLYRLQFYSLDIPSLLRRF